MKKSTSKYSDLYNLNQEDSDYLDVVVDLFDDLPNGAFLSLADEFKERLKTAPKNEINHRTE